MRPRFALSRRKALELLTEGQVKHPPVPIERLARLVGAAIHYQPFKGKLSGVVHRKADGNSVIGVNSIHPLTRRRFTIAHEIGHLLLHKSEELHVDESFPIGFRTEISSMAVSQDEIEANQFAAELLMPAELLARDLRRQSIDTENESEIATLAKRYGVSLQAMTIRLGYLGADR